MQKNVIIESPPKNYIVSFVRSSAKVALCSLAVAHEHGRLFYARNASHEVGDGVCAMLE